jgi:MerR family copper efflux transcriptional regulator
VLVHRLPSTPIHIGQVAELTGLSLRTIRHYEDLGLITPSGRTSGGFRLYDDDDIDRLLLVKRMKPLGYPLEEMRALLELVDALAGSGAAGLSPQDALERLSTYTVELEQRIDTLETHAAYAREFLARVVDVISRHPGPH